MASGRPRVTCRKPFLVAAPGRVSWRAPCHHDELNIGMLTDSEREGVFAAFAPEQRHRLYGRGIRRRLAPMLGHDQQRIRHALALTMAVPGTPVLMYGDEIGMGEDLSLPGRIAVRNPMQWSQGTPAASPPQARLFDAHGHPGRSYVRRPVKEVVVTAMHSV